MTFRIEEKLYIKKENLIQFQEFLIKKAAKKLHHPRVIESLYFDNVNLEMYSDSIEGLAPRKKIRIRNYPNSKDKKSYLEIKNSSVEGRFKTRKSLNEDEFLLKRNAGILDEQYGACFPKLYVSYLREYSIVDDVRISIDKNIQYRDFKTGKLYNDNKIIVELKTSSNKSQDELVNDFPIQRIRFSKYCFAIENLYNFN